MAHIIDLEKIEGIRQNGIDFIGRCPVCALEGRDRSKNHLSILSSGKYNCIADSSHNKGIYQLIGIGSDGVIKDVPIEQPKIEYNKTWTIDILDKLIKDYSYFEGRGISAETQKYFKIGVALTGQLAGRVIIPLIENNKIVAFTGRFIKYTKWHKENKVPKWKHLSNINDSIFCSDEQIIRKINKIIIVEGPADVLALHEKGIKNAMCIFGTKISSKQLSFIIKNNPSKILIALNNEPDNDNIGNKAAEKIKNVLLNYFDEEKILIALPKYKDFLEYLEKNDTNGLDEWREKWLS
jgi:5S rRNA maturation endonuclease (ribonuclease M5)